MLVSSSILTYIDRNFPNLLCILMTAPYISSAALGVWLSDPINNFFGRRGCIFITAIILIVTPIGSGLAQSWQGLLAARLVLGLGMGAKGATVSSDPRWT